MTRAFHTQAGNLLLREMKLFPEHYESVITLLILPRAARVWPRRTPEEEENQEAVVPG